jgi:hypothetical protein
MGLFKRDSKKNSEDNARSAALQAGVLAICDAWEADLFRTRSTWTARSSARIQLSRALAHWLEDEVLHDGGVVAELQTYEDNLALEVGEGVADYDTELADALGVQEDEQGALTKLSRAAVRFAEEIARTDEESVREVLVHRTREERIRRLQARWLMSSTSGLFLEWVGALLMCRTITRRNALLDRLEPVGR